MLCLARNFTTFDPSPLTLRWRCKLFLLKSIISDIKKFDVIWKLPSQVFNLSRLFHRCNSTTWYSSRWIPDYKYCDNVCAGTADRIYSDISKHHHFKDAISLKGWDIPPPPNEKKGLLAACLWQQSFCSSQRHMSAWIKNIYQLWRNWYMFWRNN